MNRNTEAHFSQIPSANIPRSRFDLSFSHKLTFNFGDVVPCFVKPVYPGDTFDVTTSKVVRLQTLLTPVMDNAYLDTYFFYVPFRLVWDHWEEFMGANKSSAWTPTVSRKMPVLYNQSDDRSIELGSIADHMGIPVGLHINRDDINAPSALPFRAYALICDTFFKDQNVSDPIQVTTSDTDLVYYTVGHTPASYTSDLQHGGRLYKASRYHDYFSSCLPAPQRGPSVAVPAQGQLPVYAGMFHGIYAQNGGFPVVAAYGDPTSFDHYNVLVKDGPNNNIRATSDYGAWTKGSYPGHPAESSTLQNEIPLNFWATTSTTNLSTGVTSDRLSIDINALRLAALTQSYYEALARGGARYDEIIRQFFGVISPDGRLNNPEYLGGSRVQLNVHEVTNTAQSEQDFLGDLGAMSVTADTHGDFVKSFTEHGVVIGVCVARYDTSYHQGIEKFWTLKDQFEFYNPMFSRIGEQPVYDVELYADAASMSSRSVFGYQEAWADLRHSRNMVSGLFRPNVPGSFGHWTFTDNYGSKPVLSEDWMMVDKTNVDRTLAVTSQLSNQIFADFYFKFYATRPLPMYSIPGAIGAF